MSGDFTPEQKRYLEGFVSGLQRARAPRGGSAGRQRPRAGRAGRDPSQGAGPRRRPRAASSPTRRSSSASEHPFDAYPRLQGAGRERTSRRSRPTISAGAITACSTSRRRRTPTCAGCAFRTASSSTGSSRASPTSPSATAAATPTSRRAPTCRSARSSRRTRSTSSKAIAGSRPVLARLRRRQHPQRHRHADRRHRSAGTARHAALCARVALPHPQRALALRPAAQVQRRASTAAARIPVLEDTNDIGFQAVEVRDGHRRRARHLVPPRARRHHRPPRFRPRHRRHRASRRTRRRSPTRSCASSSSTATAPTATRRG